VSIGLKHLQYAEVAELKQPAQNRSLGLIDRISRAIAIRIV
jgi:hypothetical protein